MKSAFRLVALSTLLATLTATTARRGGCTVLTQRFPTKVFYPSSDVYEYENAEFWSNTQLLDPASVGLAVGRERLGPVGVPGILLAGGINFYGNQFGFSADQVKRYEVVLANGEIVEATEKKNADLFWALKGGSSNFGVVTRFDMKTIPSKKVWAGIYTVAQQYLPQFLEATANYSSAITDPLSHIVPAVIPVPSGSEINYIGAVILFYDSNTLTYPRCFEAFTSLPNIGNTLDFKTMDEFTTETGAAVVPHINDIFVSGTVVGKTYDQLL
ncbi:hypothetical protein VE04_08764 [Pseudogymnoascus sp. 24MN13]|nr:hypothetical protein VE04_08764 [Pseudogymnoascus sp. 24MN13]